MVIYYKDKKHNVPDYTREQELRFLIDHFYHSISCTNIGNREGWPVNISSLIIYEFLKNKKNRDILFKMQREKCDVVAFPFQSKPTHEDDFFNIPGSGFDVIVETMKILRKTIANEQSN